MMRFKLKKHYRGAARGNTREICFGGWMRPLGEAFILIAPSRVAAEAD